MRAGAGVLPGNLGQETDLKVLPTMAVESLLLTANLCVAEDASASTGFVNPFFGRWHKAYGRTVRAARLR